MIDLLKNIDVQLLIWVNHFFRSEWMDQFMLFCTARNSWFPLYGVLIVVLYLSNPKQIWLNLFLIVCCVTLADQTASTLFKPLFERLRPCHNSFVADKLILIKDVCGGKYGFVSSHAANTFAVVTLFYKKNVFKNKIYLYMFFLWAILVSLSRVYLGVHYPGDIIIGALVGIFSTLLICMIQQGIERKLKKI